MPARLLKVIHTQRPGLTALTALVSLWCLLLLNVPLWSHLSTIRPVHNAQDAAFLASFFLLAGLVTHLFLTPLTLIRPLAKPLLALVLVLAASASYFVDVYGVLIDKVMIRNVLETDATESVELFTGRMLLQVGVFGILPALLLLSMPVTLKSWRSELRDRGIALMLTIAGVGVVAGFFYQDHASLLRNHRELRHMLVPVNFIAGLGSHVGDKFQPTLPYTRVGMDAKRVVSAANQKPVLVVFVLGETARAANFSLGGYPRPTNPALSRVKDLIYFPEVTSCGTSTAISVPCLFSDMGRAGFDAEEARARDNLIDIALRAGLEVQWYGNNTDCKGVCRSVPERRVDRAQHPQACIEDRPCLDGALFDDFFRSLSDIRRDRFTVIHTLGSHGPGYHLRYPAEFEQFKPACREVDFEKCSTEEIINAYDNTLLYDDHLLAKTIDQLTAISDRVDVAMLYVSDHGESLGENGLFLHALPYAIAPETQTHVPMIFWASPGFVQRVAVEPTCARERSRATVSHDHIFHTLLDLLEIQSVAKRRELTIFADCHAQAD
ncbi:MAG: phosphoethanolamine--lipid A transferase [Gammaproteobacteria bacterium]|nr:phosphoethanolamine--lipid A transferase [Gammaproteobacteria bacterium]